MSFGEMFQELVDAAAKSQGGNTYVFAPVTINVNFGTQPVLAVADPKQGLTTGDAKQKDADIEGPNKHPEASEEAAGQFNQHFEKKLTRLLEETDFGGTVGQQTLINKAKKLGFKKDAGIRLWNLLDTSTELRNLCNDYEVAFPPLGRNGKFRRMDLREIAKLEGITGVPGFGTRSQAYKVLCAL